MDNKLRAPQDFAKSSDKLAKRAILILGKEIAGMDEGLKSLVHLLVSP